MNVDEALTEGAACLRQAGLRESRAEAAVLLGDLLNLDRLGLFARGTDNIPEATLSKFRERIQRRGLREPAAYILGYRDFYKFRFLVDPGVLIPRPETETLVELALNAGLPEQSRVLDLCCGSGCVGISIQRERPAWQVVCADLSPAALQVARQNASLICGADSVARRRPDLVESDLFSALEGRFEAIVCNPPYIHPDERAALDPDLAREPDMALFHSDPLALAEKILAGARERLGPGGLLAIESAPRWLENLSRAAEFIFPENRILADLNGLERFLVARG